MDLNRGRRFENEWELKQFHTRQAEVFIKTHPALALREFVRKFEVVFFSVSNYAGGTYSPFLQRLALFGQILFRIIFCTSLVIAAWGAATGRWIGRTAGFGYLSG